MTNPFPAKNISPQNPIPAKFSSRFPPKSKTFDKKQTTKRGRQKVKDTSFSSVLSDGFMATRVNFAVTKTSLEVSTSHDTSVREVSCSLVLVTSILDVKS